MKFIFLLFLIFWAPFNHRDGKPYYVEAGFFSPAKVTIEDSDIAALLKWELIGSKMETLISRVIDNVWPTFNASTHRLGIHPSCKLSIDKMFADLKDLKMWAVKMIDATGFHAGGQFFDNWSSYGDYDQCLEIVDEEWTSLNDTIQGQYCLVDFQPPLPPKWQTYLRPTTIPALDELQSKYEFVRELKSYGWEFYNRGFRFGICVPSTCRPIDIEKLTNLAANQIGFQATLQSCEIAQPKKIESYHVVITIILGMVILTGILCGFMETVEKEIVLHDDRVIKKNETNLFCCLIEAFSVHRNFTKALSVPVTPDPATTFINGVKCIAMIWVLSVHMIIVAFQSKILRGHGKLRERNGSFYIQFFTNGQVSVDVFFFLTGFLLTYVKFRNPTKLGGIYLEIVKPVLRRAWRILPMTLLVIGLTMLLPLIGSGPTWNLMVNSIGEQCRQNWWSILYFGSNFIPFDKACSIQSWYVCVDVQLYVVFALFAYCYSRNRKIAFGSLITMGVCSTIWIIWETYFYRDPPTLLQYNYDLDKVNEYLARAHQSPEWHVGVYSVGLALGTFLADRRPWYISQSKRALGTLVSLLMLAYVFFSSVPWNRGVNPTQFETLLYVTLCKPFVAAILSWLTFLCVTGNGGFVNSFLSWRGFEWFSKFTFLVYLINMPVIFYYFGTSGGLVDSYDTVLVGLCIQFATISAWLAFFLHVFFESPLIELEKMVNRRPERPTTQAQQVNSDPCSDITTDDVEQKLKKSRKLIGQETTVREWKELKEDPPKKIGTVSRFT